MYTCFAGLFLDHAIQLFCKTFDQKMAEMIFPFLSVCIILTQNCWIERNGGWGNDSFIDVNT